MSQLKRFIRANHSFSQLQGILSKMKVTTEHKFPKDISKFSTSDMFDYATNKKYSQDKLKTDELKVWNKLLDYDVANTPMRTPLNGFEEMILLTEQGKLWKYPIDNEDGMDEEKQTPFEEHVFLDHYLKDFPKNDYIQTFMELVIAGLARNHWMTVERKRKAILFYKEYFESKREMYKQAGLEL